MSIQEHEGDWDFPVWWSGEAPSIYLLVLLRSLAATRSSSRLPALSERFVLDCFTFHVDSVLSRLMP